MRKTKNQTKRKVGYLEDYMNGIKKKWYQYIIMKLLKYDGIITFIQKKKRVKSRLKLRENYMIDWKR